MAERRKSGGAKRKRMGKKPSRRKKNRVKRGRGRPKTRSPRKKAQKAQGFASGNSYNRIRSVIWKNNREDFKNFRDTARIASAVFDDCRSMFPGETECSDKDIQGLYEERSGVKREKPVEPEIGSGLYLPQEFWNIANNVEFVLFPKYLWVISPMLMQAPSEFLAVSYDYEMTFKEWVSWCNLSLKLYRESGGASESEVAPLFKLGSLINGVDVDKPNWNEEKNRWEIEVFSCDADGERFDYGFNPTGEPTEDGEFVLAEKKVIPPTTEAPPELSSALRKEYLEGKAEVQQIEIEKLKLGIKAETQRIEIKKLKFELKAEKQRVEIDKMKLGLKAEEQRLSIEKMKEEYQIKKGQIELLAARQEKIKSEIREMKELGAPKDVIKFLFDEYSAVTNKLIQLTKKLD